MTGSPDGLNAFIANQNIVILVVAGLVATIFSIRIGASIRQWPPPALVHIGAAVNSLLLILLHNTLIRHFALDGSDGPNGVIAVTIRFVAIAIWAYLLHRLFCNTLLTKSDQQHAERVAERIRKRIDGGE